MALPNDPIASRRGEELLEGSLGKRVSIRLHDPAGGFRDLLGLLVATDQVRRKDGSVATFNRDEIFAFRIVESADR